MSDFRYRLRKVGAGPGFEKRFSIGSRRGQMTQGFHVFSLQFVLCDILICSKIDSLL